MSGKIPSSQPVSRSHAALDRIDRDELTSLPPGPARAQPFLPVHSELDALLRRPNLDEKLLEQLAPQGLDADLMAPHTLEQTKAEIIALLADATEGPASRVAQTLGAEQDMDKQIREALAHLLRG